MSECFHCGSDAVIWGGDFTFDEWGLEGEGLVHDLHCASCGARITYEIPFDDEDEEDDDKEEE